MPSSEPPVQERPGYIGKSPVEGYQDNQGTGTSLLEGETERTATVQTGENEAWGVDLVNVYKYVKEEHKEMEPFQCCGMTKAMVTK